MDMIEILGSGFFQRALIAGVMLAVISGVMGVFTTMRRASFFGDAIAHSSLAGVALGLLLGVEPLLTAFVYAALMATLLPWIKQQIEFSFDNVLGIMLPLSMGLGVVVFSFLPGYQPQLVSYLFGSMLTISWDEVMLVSLVVAVSLALVLHVLPKLSLLSVDRDYARLLGINIGWYEFLYHFLLAFTIVAGVKLVGVVLMNAMLIIPVSVAKLLAKNLKQVFWLAPIIGLTVIVLGLLVSVWFNSPSGATIATVSGSLFLVTVLIREGVSRGKKWVGQFGKKG